MTAGGLGNYQFSKDPNKNQIFCSVGVNTRGVLSRRNEDLPVQGPPFMPNGNSCIDAGGGAPAAEL